MKLTDLKQIVDRLNGDDRASVTAAEMDEAREGLRALVDETRGQAATEDSIALLTDLVAAKAAIDAEQDARDTAAAEQAAKAEQLLSELDKSAEPKADEPADGEGHAGGEQDTPPQDEPPAVAAENEDTVTEQEPELIAASGAQAIADAVTAGIKAAFAAQTPKLETPKGRTGRPTSTTPAVATRDVVNTHVYAGQNAEGRAITSTAEAARALHDKWRGPYQAANFSGRMPVLHVESSYPESRVLGQDADSNLTKIENVTGARALVAAGGLCAPLETLYDVEVVGSADRPVKNALAQFGVERGGITYRPPISAAQAVYGAGVWTMADDEAQPLGTKGTWVVECPGMRDEEIEAIYLSLEFSNITTRYDPEATAANLEQGLIAHARLAENRLLAKIAAQSKVLSGAQVIGATRDILVNLDKAIAYYRNRHRINDAVQLTQIMPGWVKSLIRADLARQMAAGDWIEALNIADSQIESFFTRRGVQPVWHLDGPTGLDEVQTVTISGGPTGGTFTLTYSGQTTAAIAYNASASAVRSALGALSNLNAEDITVTGANGGPYTVTFGAGAVEGQNVAQMTATGSFTGGSSPSVAVATTIGGGGAVVVDGVSIASQTYGPTTAGQSIPGFPDQIDSVLYPSGSWLFLDGGTLDLGLVRDSELNSRNRYRQFSETFEGAAFRGVESLRLVMSVQPNGQVSSTKDLTLVTD